LLIASEHNELLVVNFAHVDPIVQASPIKIIQQYSELFVNEEQLDPAVAF